MIIIADKAFFAPFCYSGQKSNKKGIILLDN